MIVSHWSTSKYMNVLVNVKLLRVQMCTRLVQCFGEITCKRNSNQSNSKTQPGHHAVCHLHSPTPKYFLHYCGDDDTNVKISHFYYPTKVYLSQKLF